jgi:hypothetical protein
MIAFAAAVCLMLSGCSWMDGSYVSVKPHQEQLGGTQSGTVSASNYYQLRQAMEDLVNAGTENAVIHVAEYSQDLVESGMEAAVHYICKLLPMGAYAVDSIAYEIGTGGGQPAISVSISYIHGRSELRKVRRVENMEQVEQAVGDVLGQCGDSLVLLVDRYNEVDLIQMVEDYSKENPNLVVETPQVAVGLYPESGQSRVVELKFTYQTSRDALRQMQTQVQRVFASASLYVSSDSDEQRKFSQLYTFLTERFEYKLETSITPSYSLLCHGVGDSEAFASAFSAICRQAGLDCRMISGTKAGEPRFWNLIREGDVYYHVDLLQSMAAGQLQKLTDEQMQGYVWDYSSYPSAGSSAADQ